MSSKKTAPTDDELLAELDSLSKPRTAKASGGAHTRGGAASKKESSISKAEEDILAELDNLAHRPASRSATPASKGDAIPTTAGTGRNSEEKSSTGGQRKSGESTRSYHQTFTPATTTTEESPEPETTPAAASSGGGWWGGLLSTATAAVSQAQAAVKEIQKNEEAQKWRNQLTGNIGVLRGYGGDLRSMALPTFQNILQTLAPPISAHERLQIHITHDMQHYPSLDPTIYQVFSRVMNQVEGGDLMVIQRGNNSGVSHTTQEANRSYGGWQDGPWWRSEEPRDLNAVKGIKEGTKLARTGAESFAADHFASTGGVEAAAKQATETLNESNPTRDSEIFLAIQPVTQEVSTELFQVGATPGQEGQIKEADDDKEEVLFAIYLHDPVHGIAFSTVSQPLPGQWFDWLNAANGVEGALPDSIQEIIESGGVDPREWVSEWVEESLSLAIGVIAQRYVARRMGVGAGGAGRGKGKLKADLDTKQLVESGGGEAARAMGGM